MEQQQANTSNLPKVVMGPMNKGKDKHPAPIIAACYYLGTPLPADAICKNPPSKYIRKGILTGKLTNIKKRLGSRMPEMDEEEFKKAVRRFRWKYKSQENLTYTSTDFTVYFCDWLLFARHRGFTHNDYFDFELYRKEPDVRDTFLDDEYRLHIYKVCAEKGYRDTFKDKPSFNAKFSEFVHRDWVDGSRCSLEEFKAFVEKHEKFFVKPLARTGGRGARVMHRDEDTVENLYAICQEEGLLAEEMIVQHDALAAFNASTLNTIRVLTILPADNNPQILLAVARFGRSGNVADNFHSGGVGAIVDVETGRVMTKAIDRGHKRSSIHPDSRLPILGFQYPEWEKIKETVRKAALVVPQVRNVGWDVAVTKDGNVEIVEGNSRSGFDVLQSPDQIGRKHLYDPYLPTLEDLKGIPHFHRDPQIIDIKGMEKDYSRVFFQKVERKIKRTLKRIFKK